MATPPSLSMFTNKQLREELDRRQKEEVDPIRRLLRECLGVDAMKDAEITVSAFGAVVYWPTTHTYAITSGSTTRRLIQVLAEIDGHFWVGRRGKNHKFHPDMMYFEIRFGDVTVERVREIVNRTMGWTE